MFKLSPKKAGRNIYQGTWEAGGSFTNSNCSTHGFIPLLSH